MKVHFSYHHRWHSSYLCIRTEISANTKARHVNPIFQIFIFSSQTSFALFIIQKIPKLFKILHRHFCFQPLAKTLGFTSPPHPTAPTLTAPALTHLISHFLEGVGLISLSMGSASLTESAKIAPKHYYAYIII